MKRRARLPEWAVFAVLALATPASAQSAAESQPPVQPDTTSETRPGDLPADPGPAATDLKLAEAVEEVLTQLDGMERVEVRARAGRSATSTARST